MANHPQGEACATDGVTVTVDVVAERLETARKGERAYYIRKFLRDGTPFDMVVTLKGDRVTELRTFVEDKKAVFRGREAHRMAKRVLPMLWLYALVVDEFYEKSYAKRFAMVLE